MDNISPINIYINTKTRAVEKIKTCLRILISKFGGIFFGFGLVWGNICALLKLYQF